MAPVVTVEVAEEVAEEVAADVVAEVAADCTEGQRPALLVVEDDQMQRQCLRRILDSEWSVYYAETLEEADLALTRHTDIGILLCDHELPDGNGLDFCERLFKRDSPVVRILVTGHTGMSLLMQAVNSQCLFHFLAKPFEIQELMSVLQRAQQAYELSSRERALRLEREQRAEKSPVKQTVSHWVQIIFGVGSFLLATLLVVTVVALVLGSFAFVVLYLLKSLLGIDMFADRHLEDYLPFYR